MKNIKPDTRKKRKKNGKLLFKNILIFLLTVLSLSSCQNNDFQNNSEPEVVLYS